MNIRYYPTKICCHGNRVCLGLVHPWKQSTYFLLHVKFGITSFTKKKTGAWTLLKTVHCVGR